MELGKKITQLSSATRKVILDCCLKNGAIVAANSKKPYFPIEAKNYYFVWPRDAAFIMMAADALGISGVQQKFFNWLLKCEDFQKTGLFFEKYYVDGKKARHRFQPDQTATILFYLASYCKNNPGAKEKNKQLILRAAHGLCSVWHKDHFSVVTNDLWEERLAFPDLNENFSYSLAACSAGLSAAYELLPHEIFKTTAGQMRNALLLHGKKLGYFSRSYGKLPDKRIDASSLGSIWPFAIVSPDDPLAIATVTMVEQHLVKDFGVYRYEHDEYDGWMLGDIHRKKGAGYWPLLNFWMAIVQQKMGNRKKVLQYFHKPIIESAQFLPEQIFNNDIQVSVKPLAWSHAMFVLTEKELDIRR